MSAQCSKGCELEQQNLAACLLVVWLVGLSVCLSGSLSVCLFFGLSINVIGFFSTKTHNINNCLY